MVKILEVQDLHKSFGGIKAVAGCDFTVEKGRIVALIGPNGAGKTTVFNIISGFINLDKGNVILEGADITHESPYRRALAGIARTFQIIRLFPKMTAMENMLLAMKHEKEGLLDAVIQGKELQRIEDYNQKDAMDLLRFVDLHVKANDLAGNLSYGQQKLLEIAKALAQDPKILMLDEPASGVNPTMLKKIGELLLELKKQGKTILFIEHDMEFVMKIADKVVVMDYGDEIAVGTPNEIQRNKKVIDAYLGVAK